MGGRTTPVMSSTVPPWYSCTVEHLGGTTPVMSSSIGSPCSSCGRLLPQMYSPEELPLDLIWKPPPCNVLNHVGAEGILPHQLFNPPSNFVLVHLYLNSPLINWELCSALLPIPSECYGSHLLCLLFIEPQPPCPMEIVRRLTQI